MPNRGHRVCLLVDSLLLLFSDHSLCPLPTPGLAPAPLQIKELQLVLAEAHDSLRGLQEQLSQERQLRKEEADSFNQKVVQVGLYHILFSSVQPPPGLKIQRSWCSSVAEHLPGMWESLGSVPSMERNPWVRWAAIGRSPGSAKEALAIAVPLCP